MNKARQSFETFLVDKKILKALGGQDAVVGILEALAKSLTIGRKKRRAA